MVNSYIQMTDAGCDRGWQSPEGCTEFCPCTCVKAGWNNFRYSRVATSPVQITALSPPDEPPRKCIRRQKLPAPREMPLLQAFSQIGKCGHLLSCIKRYRAYPIE